MKKGYMVALVASFTFIVAIVAYAATAPAKINLHSGWKVAGKVQKDVVFLHGTHSSGMVCTTCHASNDGGKFVPTGNYKLNGTKYTSDGAKLEIKGAGIKNAAHAFCYSCHADVANKGKKQPKNTDCKSCHTGA
ncbi:hypothetical protein RsTz2092_12740 [Deferribacterales bacterium RsTz2092]|nr:hypothetical protein AGMMS49941_11720 [Deferribacterales bacterium]